ncbi:MAG: insulinase family protein [Bacteriovoracaceae bacterium]|jgi:zinc protease|nr:insulinase family protein [Bacteriovoracaceae bacterium]
MKLVSMSFLLILFIGCSSKSEQQVKFNADSIEFNAVKKEFKNGLKAIVIENKKLPIFSYYTFYQVGGKHETQGLTGASHFLEHMMFKGAKKYKMGDFDRLVEGNGGNNNAYTSNDLTVYYENMPSEHLELMIDIEADRMENLTLDEKAFESEKQVVLEERRMRYENSDRGKIFLAMMKQIFKGSAYGTSVIGKIKDIKTVSRNQIYNYFKKYYAPNNAVIVIVGDVDSNKTFDLIEKKFANIKAFKDLEKVKLAALSQKTIKKPLKLGYDVKLKGQSPVPSFILAYPGIKIGPYESYVLDILSSILGDGASSYLNQKYVLSRKPLLSNIYAANYTLQDGGVFFIGGKLIRSANLNIAKKSLRRLMHRSCKKSINQRTLAKVKNQYLVQMFSGLDTNASIAKFIGNREVYFGDYRFYKKEMQTYQSITVDDLKKACDKYFHPKKSVFLSIWNKHR